MANNAKNTLKGISIIIAIPTLTPKSPKPHVIQGRPDPAKAAEMNMVVSVADANVHEIKGALHHVIFLNLSNIHISKNCAKINANPEARAIRIEVHKPKSASVERITDNKIPNGKPIIATIRACLRPKILLVKSATKKTAGYVNAPQVIQSLIGY